MLQCGAVSCSELQCVAFFVGIEVLVEQVCLCCSVLQCGAVCCSKLQRGAVSCSGFAF